MRITYIKNGKTYITDSSNDDLNIILDDKDNRHIVRLLAKQDIKLVSANEVIPFHVNFKDRYFLNGYQSWTDSHEYSLFKRLRNIKKSPHIISRLFAMRAYGDSYFYKYSIRKSHGYDFFYSKGSYESFIINLNSSIAYLLIELIKDRRSIYLTSDVNGIKLGKSQTIKIFDYCFFDSYQKGLEEFNRRFPKKNIEKLYPK